MNKVILIGNVGKEPEIISLENGNKIAKFGLATSEYFKDKSGERKTETTWHNVVVFGKTAEIVEKYVSKGSKVAVDGKIQVRDWETREGEKRRSFEIVLRELTLLDKKDSAQSPGSSPAESFVTSDANDDLPF